MSGESGSADPAVASRGDRRIACEKRTIQVMVELFCRAHHGPQQGLCLDCCELLEYAYARLDRCPFGGDKPACARCPVHCYRPAMRAKAKEVMRYAGPRMLFRHPILALRHQWHSLKRPPRRPGPRK